MFYVKKLLAFLLIISVDLNASDNRMQYDSSVFYTKSDMLKTKLNKVFFCGNINEEKPPYYLYKIDLFEEKIIYADVYNNFMVIEPIIVTRNTKNITQFKAPPEKYEGAIDDENEWRRWYLDKISLKVSLRIFYDLQIPDFEGYYLDPINYECIKELPKSWGF